MEIEKVQSTILEVERRTGMRLDKTSAIFLLEIKRMISAGGNSLALDRERPAKQAFFYGFGQVGFSLLIVSIAISIAAGFYIDNQKITDEQRAKMTFLTHYFDSVENASKSKNIDNEKRSNTKKLPGRNYSK